MHLLHLLVFLSAPLAASAQVPDAPEAGAGAASAASAARGDAQAPEVARIPVQIVHDKLVVACQLSAAKRIPVNLFIDYEAPVGLLLHNRAAAGIVAENEDGTPNPITVHLPDLNVGVAAREVGDEAPYEEFTKWYSKELGENAVVGTLGARVLSRYHVVFDLHAGFLELSAPRERTTSAPGSAPASDRPAAPPAGTLQLACTLYNDVVWLPVRYGGDGAGKGGALGLATSRYDTLLAREIADELERPAGDIGPVRLDELDLARYVALRPAEVDHVHPDGVFGLTGLNLLRHFRVEIDRVQRLVRWTPTAPARFPTEDLEYFRARAGEDAAALATWLEAHADQRLAGEAAEFLLDLELDRAASAETVQRCLAFVHATRPADLKATGALKSMGRLFERGLAQYVVAAGELGLQHGRADRYPDAVHKIHARLGDVLLAEGQRDRAWKHLLSAAFGLPEDGALNLDLARYYEDEGRPTRAFSRYLQALLSAESGPAALEGLMRVQPLLPEAESFSVDEIEKRIEGKVLGFGVATRFKPEPGEQLTRTSLIELYCNPHDPGELGVALARDGLRDHFTPEQLVQVSYHIAEPELVALCNPLSAYMNTQAGGGFAHRLDGLEELPPRGLARHKEALYEACRAAAQRAVRAGSEHTIEATAEVSAERVRGSVTVRGPDVAGGLLQILLVERCVLYAGKSEVVLQRNVARAALTPWIGGEDFAPVAGVQTIPFERALAEIEAETRAFHAEAARQGAALVPAIGTRIDPRQALVVVILRQRDTGEVLQARRVEPTYVEELR